jgi:peptidoglycan hydrolase CwlO-like protein
MKARRRFSVIAAAALCICLCPVPVQADDPDYSDTDYWTEVCTNTDNLNGSMKESCQAFVIYMTSQSSSLAEKLSEIDQEQTEVSDSIDTYQELIDSYQEKVDSLNSDISDLQGEIDDLDQEIQDLTDTYNNLKAKLEKQISNEQPTMRLSKVFDILLGAKSFNEMIRLANAMSDVTEYNNSLLEKMEAARDALAEKKDELAGTQDELQGKQEDAIAAVYAAQLVQQEYEAQADALDQEETDTAQQQENADAAVTAVQQAQQEAEKIAELARQAAAQRAAEAAEAARQAAAAQKAAEEAAAAAEEEEETATQETGSGDTETATLPSVYVANNASSIYVALVTTYGFTKAAACGIIANIQIESTFNPAAGSTYYGLCQWGGSRKTSLLNYLAANGYAEDSLAGQLAFMVSEMQSYGMISTMNSFADSAEGASEAGVYFRENYERSAGLDNVASIAASYYASLGD